MIEKVISGGQTGADQAGLRAAKDSGLLTGGWLPNGCITLDGPRPDLLDLYSMQEHPKKGYPPRTEANVRDSDGTMRFADSFKTPGEKCTLKAIKWFRKPYMDLSLRNLPSLISMYLWVRDNNIKVLNVAGNSDGTCPGIGDVVYIQLTHFFKMLKGHEHD